jgi:hypothetical protein
MATSLREPGSVTRLSADTFEVIGRQGDAYQVTIRPGDVRCTCPAGRFHRHCWHLDRLAEHLAALARRSGSRTVARSLRTIRFREDGSPRLVPDRLVFRTRPWSWQVTFCRRRMGLGC